MSSMVPYRSVFGLRPFNTSLLDAFDDMMDFAQAPLAKAFPIDVEDTGEGYEVKATDFLKIGVPFTLLAVLTGYLYCWFVWA